MILNDNSCKWSFYRHKKIVKIFHVQNHAYDKQSILILNAKILLDLVRSGNVIQMWLIQKKEMECTRRILVLIYSYNQTMH